MIYSNARYQPPILGPVVAILVDIDGSPSVVPLDPANTDYQQIMALVDEGKLVIQPAEEPTE